MKILIVILFHFSFLPFLIFKFTIVALSLFWLFNFAKLFLFIVVFDDILIGLINIKIVLLLFL